MYCQRKKNETILSVIKRKFGEQITSRLLSWDAEEGVNIQGYGLQCIG